MSAPDGSEIDTRHPSWCDPARCEALNTTIVGDHRSRIMTVRAREPYDTTVEMWLRVPVHGPVTEEPWLYVQLKGLSYNGEIDWLTSISLRLNQAEDLGEALSSMADLGRSGEPVDEDEWRGGAS